MYKRLVWSGELDQALDKAVVRTRQEQNRIQKQLEDQEKPETDFMKRVQQLTSIQHQAWEMVRERYLFLPSEEDKPNL